MKKNVTLFILVVLFFGVFGVTFCHGQSKQETMNFIIQKISKNWRNSQLGSYFDYSLNVHFDGCKMIAKNEDGKTWIIPLNRMDPSRVEMKIDTMANIFDDQLHIVLVAFNDEECIQYNGNMTSFASINIIRDEVIGQRVVKALSHLIKLCGGKEELF